MIPFWAGWDLAGARCSLRAHFAPLACLAVQALFVVAFFVTARYRPSLLPLLVNAAHAGLYVADADPRTPPAGSRRGGPARAAAARLELRGRRDAGFPPALEHADLARTLKEHGKVREAEAELRAALAATDFPAANDQLCALLIFASRAPEAATCSKAVAAWPDSPALHHELGAALGICCGFPPRSPSTRPRCGWLRATPSPPRRSLARWKSAPAGQAQRPELGATR